MKKKQNIFRRFFGVIISGKTYINLLYLFLAFPLGLMYFIFLVVGFSLGFAMLIVLVGIAVLALVVAGWWGFANLERQLANHMLGESIPPLSRAQGSDRGLGESILAHLSNPITWKSLLYLFLKFPVGVLTFSILVALFSLTGFFATAIFTFSFFNLDVELTRDLVWRIDTIWEALLALPIGILLGFISLHLCNVLARLSGQFTRVMLTSSYQSHITSPDQIKPASVPAAPFTDSSYETPVDASAGITKSISQDTGEEETLPSDEPEGHEEGSEFVSDQMETLKTKDAWMPVDEDQPDEANNQ